MRRFALLAFLLLIGTSSAMAAPPARDALLPDPYALPGSFVVLSYHEARDEVRDYPDPYAVDSAALVRQFAWLRGNGYTPVSLDDIVNARAGGKPLPAHAVLLSFDDAYLSFYTRVYPLLRAFGYPAVLAVVGRWIDAPHAAATPYGEKATVAEASFPTWGELREMADSGLVELASHTYDLHRGVPANPQGNLQPAATARTYDAGSGRYESDADWRTRVAADLLRNAAVIERETGRRPRAVVWPYGSYNGELVRVAGAAGMDIGLTLDDGVNTPGVPLSALRRTLVEHDPSLAEFAVEVRGARQRQPLRVVQVSLDQVYSDDPLRQESNLSALLEYVDTLKPTHVFLQATTDVDGDGVADASYFPNRRLPLRGDLFNRAAWQLASRTDVKVFALMPLAGRALSSNDVAEVYEDLARYASFDGLVFVGTPGDDAGPDFTRRLSERVSAFRLPLPTVRAVDVAPLPGAPPDLAAPLAACDYVALMLPSDIAPAAPASASADQLIFMLGSAGGTEQTPASQAASRQMRALQLDGVLNFGIVAADFIGEQSALGQIAPAMSLRVYPKKQNEKER